MKALFTVLLTLLWVSASIHCKLEQIPGLEFLSCCAHEDSAPHEDDDCETDVCATLENRLYKTETAQISVAAPQLLFTTFLPLQLAESSAPPDSSQMLPDAAPMALTRVWQFFCRAALPPRAPSLLS